MDRHRRGDRSVTGSASLICSARIRSLGFVITGPLDTESLLEAIDRSRRFRHRTHFTATELGTALIAVGAEQGPDGEWHSPPGVRVPDRYRVIVERAAGRDLNRAGMIEILISAGYTRSSATGRMSSSHPLFERIGPDRYRLIGTPTAPRDPPSA